MHRGAVTPLGRLSSSLQVDANVGRLLLFGAVLGCARDAAVIAAAISLRDVFITPFSSGAPADSASGAAAGENDLASALKDVEAFTPRYDMNSTAGCARSDPLVTLALHSEWWRKKRTDGSRGGHGS